MSQTLGMNICRLSLAVVAGLALYSTSTLAATEVRWSQWKTTEVGEKFMAEFKAAFEKDNPDITLTLVDSPLTAFQGEKAAGRAPLAGRLGRRIRRPRHARAARRMDRERTAGVLRKYSADVP